MGMKETKHSVISLQDYINKADKMIHSFIEITNVMKIFRDGRQVCPSPYFIYDIEVWP